MIIPLLAGLVLSDTAFALSPTDQQSAEIRAFDMQQAKLSAADALGYAELYTVGEVLDVRFEVRNGGIDYLVHVLKNDEIITITIDASIGLARTPVSLVQAPAPSLADERAAAAALKHSNVVFDEAITAAEHRLSGSTVGARLALRGGRPTVEVNVVRNQTLYNTTIDPMTDLDAAEGR
jgi:uncharacterized membrane protein YkoI